MDDKTTVQQLKQEIEDFVNERDWAQFHSPKNLAMALADIMIYAMAFANRHDIDIAAAVTEKMTKNRVKYPAEKFQGHF